VCFWVVLCGQHISQGTRARAAEAGIKTAYYRLLAAAAAVGCLFTCVVLNSATPPAEQTQRRKDLAKVKCRRLC
jgi:hypothetical protein